MDPCGVLVAKFYNRSVNYNPEAIFFGDAHF